MNEAADSAPALELRGVRAGAGRDARDGAVVTLSIPPGRVHALVGRNGSGKTTLLRAILGEVEFAGSIRRRGGALGYVPQSFAPDRTLALTVGELLAAARQRLPVALATTAAARARVAGALRLVGLDGFERRLLCELSGGELRRVLIGHAFEPRPALLLLDEPTEGLDEESAARFLELLRDARATGAAALLVTHDSALVERIADDVTPMAAR